MQVDFLDVQKVKIYVLELRRFLKLNKSAVIRRASYDQSTKEFEVLRITYRWDKYGRKLSNEPKWHHYKYYKTLNSALDAVRDFRNSWYDKVYYDYPAMTTGIENEKEYYDSPAIKKIVLEIKGKLPTISARVYNIHLGLFTKAKEE